MDAGNGESGQPPPYNPVSTELPNHAAQLNQPLNPEAQQTLATAPYPPPQGVYPPEGAACQPHAQGTYPPQGAPFPPQGAYPTQGAAYPAQGTYPPGAYATQGALPREHYPQQPQSKPLPGYDQPPPKYQATPPNYQQPHDQPPTNYGAVTHQPTMVAGTTTVVHLFSNHPTMIACPKCHQLVTSRVKYESGTIAWLSCLVLFMLGLWLCCWIPFIIDDLKDAVHTCPMCDHELGRYRRM